MEVTNEQRNEDNSSTTETDKTKILGGEQHNIGSSHYERVRSGGGKVKFLGIIKAGGSGEGKTVKDQTWDQGSAYNHELRDTFYQQQMALLNSSKYVEKMTTNAVGTNEDCTAVIQTMGAVESTKSISLIDLQKNKDLVEGQINIAEINAGVAKDGFK